MRFMSNIKVGTRLYLMIGIIVACLFIAMTVTVIGRLQSRRDLDELYENYVSQMGRLSEINMTAGNLFLSYRNYYLEYPDRTRLQIRLNDINIRTNSIITSIEAYMSVLQRTNNTQELANAEEILRIIRQEVVPTNQHLVRLMQAHELEEARQFLIGDEMRDLRIHLQEERIAALVDNCLQHVENRIIEINAEMRTSNIRLIVAVSALVVLVIVFSTVTIFSITKPLKQLAAISLEAAQGRLNHHIDDSANNEVGWLAENIKTLMGVFTTLLNDLRDMSEAHDKGETDHMLDAARYAGEYGSVAEGINNMVTKHIGITHKVIDVYTEIANGNFDAPLEKLPGKQVYINEAVEDMRAQIKNIIAVIDSMVGAAAAGMLSDRINADSYKGDWASLMNELNSLMEAIASPINEASEVMRLVSAGDFSRQVTGDYKGDFNAIKESVNTTVAHVSSYIEEISHVLGELARNNLAQGITREYIGSFASIKNALNNIIDTLNTVLGDISTSADHVSSGAASISDSSMTLASGAGKQAELIHELDARISGINASAERNAHSAENADTVAKESQNSADAGDRNMKKMLQSMDGIKESSSRITKIIKDIEDISFQTNLLSLNAAVEAARAGEHGRGFMVVAEEVRTLATRSQTAARETAELIKESTQRVDEGTVTAGKTADALRTIVNDISRLAAIIADISKASNAQTEDIKQVVQGLALITEVVQDNSRISTDSAAAAEELSSQSEVMKNMVKTFILKR